MDKMSFRDWLLATEDVLPQNNNSDATGPDSNPNSMMNQLRRIAQQGAQSQTGATQALNKAVDQALTGTVKLRPKSLADLAKMKDDLKKPANQMQNQQNQDGTLAGQ